MKTQINSKNISNQKKNIKKETTENKKDNQLDEKSTVLKDTKRLIFTIISSLVLLVGLIVLGLFSYHIFKLNLIPLKFILLGYGFLVLLMLPILFILFRKNHYILKTCILIILVIMTSGCFYANTYLKSTTDFLTKAESKHSSLSYSVIVLKTSSFNSIDDLINKNISHLESANLTDVKTKMNISYSETVKTDFTILANDLLNGRTDAIVLESGFYTLAIEEIKGFEDNTKVIYTFEVETKEDTSSLDDTKIATEPFILYISGIDQRGKISSVRGRSDVNQLLIVNPKTHHILIVNTPRDYYVQLHGTTGLKDKLTHAGIYGINKSVETLEDLYGIDINHYMRVNFNTLETLVDVIGGVDIEVDQSFYMSHIKGKYLEKGLNHFNGKEALAYSRERYAYTTGDNHRGENQQQVIKAIIDKVTTSEVLIKKYTSILSTLEGSFQTDLSAKEITSLVKMQLDEMPSWKVESTAVTGYGSSNYTYSMGRNYLLYVMEPNMSSVNAAKTKIKEVLHEN